MKTFAALLALMLAGAHLTAACNAAEVNRIDPPLPLNANTTHVCWDGSTCMNWEACPPPGYPKAGCEAQIDPGPGDPNGTVIGKRRRGRREPDTSAEPADASDD